MTTKQDGGILGSGVVEKIVAGESLNPGPATIDPDLKRELQDAHWLDFKLSNAAAVGAHLALEFGDEINRLHDEAVAAIKDNTASLYVRRIETASSSGA